MKTFIKLMLLGVFAAFLNGCGLAVSAHPTATGKSCHLIYDQHSISIDVNQVAIVGGDVLHPPCYMAQSPAVDNNKVKGFDSAMLPAFYSELRIYSWYMPQTIGKPLTKSAGSINWQSNLVMRSDHDKL